MKPNREGFKRCLADFFCQLGTSSHPLWVKKKLGGILPPLYGESTTLTPGKFQRKQLKMVFLRKTKLKVDQTGPKMNQKRAKNRLKLAEVSVFVSKIICLFFHEKLGKIGWHPRPCLCGKCFWRIWADPTPPHPLYL